MFKRVLAVFILTIIIIASQGCTSMPIESDEKILAPHNSHLPLEGAWEVVDRLGADIMPSEEDKMIGTTAFLSADRAIFGDDVATHIQYKIRRVDVDEFFLYQYKAIAKELGISKERVDVVSISTDNKSFREFVKIDDNNIITFVDNNFYMLTKKDYEENNILSSIDGYNKDDIYISEDSSKEELRRSGILLGLRGISNTEDGSYDIRYRTLWISAENKEPRPILETTNLLVPRKTGFWEVGCEEQKVGSYIHDHIYAYPNFLYEYPTGESEVIVAAPKDFLKSSNDAHLRRHIEYVGNDYVAVEDINIKQDSSIDDRKYQVLPIDNVENSSGVKIIDIAGKAGKDAFYSSAQVSLDRKELNDFEFSEDVIDEENFTVSRRKGHWIMRGRADHINGSGIDDYLDFNINIIPPTKLVSYDELSIPWNVIKGHLPTAIDAYTSPNSDIVIVLDIDNIYVYTIEEKHLSERPIYQIPLYEGEQVVMAEWATGTYVDRWEEHFKYREPIELDIE